MRYGALAAGDTGGRLLILVSFILATRAMPPTDVGVAALFTVITGFAGVGTALGLDVYGSNQILTSGRSDSRPTFSKVVGARLFLFLPSAAVGGGILAFLTVDVPSVSLALLETALLCTLAAGVFNAGWVGVGLGRTWPIGAARLGARALVLLAVSTVYSFRGLTVENYVLLIACGQGVETLLLLRVYRLRLVWPRLQHIRIIGLAKKYSALSLLTSTYSGADHVVLASLSSAAALAPYAESYRIFWVAGGVVILLSDALWRRLSVLGPGRPSYALRGLGGACAASVACGAIAKYGIPNLFHHGDEDLGTIASILFAGLPFLAIRVFSEKLLLVQGSPGTASLTVGGVLLLNLTLNLVLDGRYHGAGAAIASTVSEVSLAAVGCILATRALRSVSLANLDKP